MKISEKNHTLKTVLLIFVLMLLVACKNSNEQNTTSTAPNTAPLVTSSNEDQAIKEILEFYAGKLTYGVGTVGNKQDGLKNYFQLEISESEVIDDFEQTPEMPASNIAYLFYKNLRQERDKYKEIHTVLVSWRGTKERYRYPTAQLEKVHKRMETVYKLVTFLKNQDITSVGLMLDNDLFGYEKEDLLSEIRRTEPQLGSISEFLPYGYSIATTETGQEILHISGALIRDIENNGFSIDLDLNSTEEKVLFLQYKL